MGITGLLPLLKESVDQTHISKFRNQRLAVDGYCWLHRALYGSTLSDMTGKSLNESTRWIQYCMGILDMLLSYEIEVYLVFDGKNLPAKERTEADRAASRSKNLELGYEEKRKGNKAEARSLLARSVDVSPRMAAQFMQVLRKHRPQVKFVVAPYEADAQLSFLCANDLVDGVISEDSDCVPYGCKSILFKLDKQSGQCSHLSLATLKTHSTKGFDLQKFDSQMMVTMCVAAGCDYAASPKNFGLKTSHRLVSKLRTPGRLLK
jgi:exonuclease-1